MLKAKTFQTTSWGKIGQGQLWLPINPGKRPAVVFFHGLNATDPNKFLTEGALQPIAQGWASPYVTFGVAGAASGGYPPEPSEMKYVLENDPEIAEYWDGVNVMWTGLSQGGNSTLWAASLGYQNVFVPMSSPAFDPNRIDGAKTYKTWAFHSDNDTVCPLNQVVTVYDKMKAKKTIPHDGHGNWNYYYNPLSKFTAINSPDPLMNIYDWGFGPAVAPKLTSIYYVFSDGSTREEKQK